MLADRKSTTIAKSLRSVFRVYRARGFKVTFTVMDGEFESLRGDISALGATLNTTSNDEHVGDIERQIRTIKERCRCLYNTLPFTKMPARLVIEMVYASVFWINSFPPNDGISKVMSPKMIVTGQQVDFNRYCQLEFGAYVQTHDDSDNTMTSRTTGAIALRPTGNSQGGYYFMSLSTGKRLNRYNWTILPMPNEVVDRVHVSARRQSANRGLLFLNREGRDLDEEDQGNGEPMDMDDNMDGDDDDSTYAPADDEYDTDDESDFGNEEGDEIEEADEIDLDLPAEIPGVDLQNPMDIPEGNVPPELELELD